MFLLQDETNKWRKRYFIFMQSGASIGGCDPRIQESCGVNSIFLQITKNIYQILHNACDGRYGKLEAAFVTVIFLFFTFEMLVAISAGRVFLASPSIELRIKIITPPFVPFIA